MVSSGANNSLKMGLILSIMFISNYMSFSLGKYTSLFSEYFQYDLNTAASQRPCYGNDNTTNSSVTIAPSLRGAAIATDDAHDVPDQGLLSKPKFTQPSPHLWADVPVVPPHTGHKKVLVTGAAGFIGSHVASFLLERGDEVIVVDEVNDYYDVRIKEGNLNLLREKAKEMTQKQNKGGGVGGGENDILTIYRGDINNQTLMKGIFEDHKPQWVCHLAARAGVRPSIQQPLLYVRANVEGTANMLEYSRQYNVTNVVLASSSSVYGESESTYFSEAEIVDEPVSPYAATKRSGEVISYTYNKLYGLNVTLLRFFTVYGPRGRPDMAPYKFISRVSRGEVIEKYGDGSTSRDYTYVEDIVDGVVRAVDRPYPYHIINLGKGSGTKLNEFISLVEKYVGKKAKIKLMPEQPGDVPFTNADVSKAKRLLGYESRVTMEDGIQRTVSWFKETFGDDGMGIALT
ncbi:hypothetical protein ACHAXR_009643 [Thalassiosira sp. AJA248-18]